MRSAKSVRRVLLALSGVLVLLGIGTVAQAGPSGPDFAISISPSSQSVQRGQTATYTVTVTALNGWTGAVALTTSGGPAGTTLGATSLSPSAASAATTTLTVPTTSSTAIGSYTVTVNGAGARLKRSASAGLTVNYPVSSSISLAMTPSSLSVPAGASGAWSVQLARSGFTGDVLLRIFGALPEGVTGASFSPPVLSGTAASSTLTITTDPAARLGSGTVYIVASSASGGSPYAYAQGQVEITSAQGKPFTLRGGATAPLAPGSRSPIDLVVDNGNSSSISITSLTVSITGTDRSTCSAGDFSVQQYQGPYPLAVPARTARSLTELQVDPARFPQLVMRNSAANQDGCKGASISLAYSGSARGD